MKIKIFCKICFKEFEKEFYLIKRGEGKYCSRSCCAKSRKKKINVNCSTCNKDFYVIPSRMKNREKIYCSRSCLYKSYIGKKLNYYSSRSLGKKRSQESKIKQSLVAKQRGIGKWMKGRPKYKNAYSFPKGEKHPFWKGGVTSLYNVIKSIPQYKKWRKDVFRRDKWICQECKYKIRNIEAHHKISFKLLFENFLKQYSQFSPIEDKETLVRLSFTYEPFWDVNNGITLCKECHNKKRITLLLLR